MSEMTLSEAAAEVAKFGQTVRAFAKCQEAAQTLLGLEQVKGERQAALDKLQADIDAAKAQLASLSEKIDQATVAAAKTQSNAQSQADALLSKAHAGAEAVKAAAQAEVNQAQDQAAAALSAEKESLARVAEATEQLNTLQAKIAAAKAQAKALFEGAA